MQIQPVYVHVVKNFRHTLDYGYEEINTIENTFAKFEIKPEDHYMS